MVHSLVHMGVPAEKLLVFWNRFVPGDLCGWSIFTSMACRVCWRTAVADSRLELSQMQPQSLADIIESGQLCCGFDCGGWTSPRNARGIEEEFGVDSDSGDVRNLLHRMIVLVQRPRPVLVRTDPTGQNRWHRYDYSRLKRSPAPRPAADFYR